MEGKVIFTGTAKDGIPLVIRYPSLGDIQVMLDYINTLSKEQTFIRLQGEQLTYDFEENFVKEILQKISEHKSVYLLVFSEGNLIGAANVMLGERISQHTGTFGLTIAKEYRRRGIGKLLMQKALDEAGKELDGLRLITLGVFANNPIAIGMYKQFGFQEYGRLPGDIFYKGKYVDHVYMYKKIR